MAVLFILCDPCGFDTQRCEIPRCHGCACDLLVRVCDLWAQGTKLSCSVTSGSMLGSYQLGPSDRDHYADSDSVRCAFSRTREGLTAGPGLAAQSRAITQRQHTYYNHASVYMACHAYVMWFGSSTAGNGSAVTIRPNSLHWEGLWMRWRLKWLVKDML